MTRKPKAEPAPPPEPGPKANAAIAEAVERNAAGRETKLPLRINEVPTGKSAYFRRIDNATIPLV
jgi:hypothetical protein